MASGSKFRFSDMQNPLFLHPSNNPFSISVTKLQGAGDYRSWKRSMEIQLSSKRKLGFVDGTEVKNLSSPTEALQWDTCNSMVTSWIHNNVSDFIKNSILFITSASEVWKQLEKRFQLTHGSRKYKLSREMFELKQNGCSVVDFYTSLSSLWEEIESMNLLPTLTTVTLEMTILLQVLTTQKEEAKLLQFLNGLDDLYIPQRSQLLLLHPLPSVEMACAAIQQEESQRDILKPSLSFDNDMSAMLSKVTISPDRNLLCSVCGGKGHTADKCWNVVGYPKWHYKYKPKPSLSPKPSTQSPKWPNTKPNFSPKGAHNVSVSRTPDNQTPHHTLLSAHQLQQLLQLLPSTNWSNFAESQDDTMDSPFSGMISCNVIKSNSDNWIVDIGATDHMIANLGLLKNVKEIHTNTSINLPTGDKAKVTRVGDVYLRSDAETKQVKGKGTVFNGLYYMSAYDSQPMSNNCAKTSDKEFKLTHTEQYALWHNRLGHASASTLKLIDCIKHCTHVSEQICLTYPMAKFSRLPFSLSDSRADKAFELIHTDIWGPHKQSTSSYVKRQFNDTKVKKVRSGNALEFDDAACRNFFQTQGIQHKTLYNYRPQPDTRVERKHRHMLEVARALMFQSGIPLSFWGESVPTAAYLINRLPSQVLQNKCPYDLLYGESCDYTELKSFGCLCFATNHVHSNDNFAAKGVPCVFVGYPST
ncbi:uncharacterized protein LOC141660189 [Apium graveolens]|uniref:uncharacterized protein LOC141660189 n=1 Tax=Apium graveolens TaxID=4045 RepID=UPI003D7A4A80